jgi:hypothetical protein
MLLLPSLSKCQKEAGQSVRGVYMLSERATLFLEVMNFLPFVDAPPPSFFKAI